MKIVQICTYAMTGSVGSIVRNICDTLKENNDEYLICYGQGNNPQNYNTYKFDNDFDIYMHVLLSRLTDSDGLHSKKATKKLIKKLEEFKPDIVHIHCLHGYYINYPILFNYLNAKNIKVIWTMHDCWAFTGHCCNFEFKNCNKWKKECDGCIQTKSYPKSYLDRSKVNYHNKKRIFNMLNYCVLVTPSLWLKNIIKQSFLNELPVILINNGIDINTFKPTYDVNVLKKYNINKNSKKTIICVASVWTEDKGINDIIDLASQMDNQKYQLILVGKKDDCFKVPNNVLLINRTNDTHELATLYTYADVFFNPTNDDNYPTVNLESIACGTPVVTYDTGGSGEIIKKTKAGMIVKKGDFDSLLKYIDNDNKKQLQKDLINCRNIISKKLMCNQYIELYNKIINDIIV